jgi:PilZ domain
MTDLVFVASPPLHAVNERREISIITSIPGRYALTRQIDMSGKRREFPCRVVKISPDTMMLAAPTNGEIGERVVATLLEFGRLEGLVLRNYPRGFEMSVTLSDQDRELFASRIAWYEKHKNYDIPDQRKFRRIVPMNPHSTVVRGDGNVVRAYIIDVSIAGVRVSADIEPAIGERVAIGSIVGTVVRHLPGGFGVEFLQIQDPRRLEKSLLWVAPTVVERKASAQRKAS